MHLNNSLKNYLNELRREKKQKRRLASFITAMSVFVSTGVFWQLRGIGTAMTDDTLTHDKSDTAAALSDNNNFLCETDRIWKSTLPELTDELAENAALIAASQIGYTENEQNYTLSDDGCTHKNYNRYGAWFGNPYGDWNTMFTCFCLYYAGVKEADIPFSSGCWAWSLKLNEKGILLPLSRGSPKRGDVLLFDTDLDGKADRSGIISEISAEADEPYILTIEGQVNGAVAECRYSHEDERIMGYVPVETPENENVSLMEFSAESESGIEVSALAEKGVFPDGTEMRAADVPRDDALEKAADALGEESGNIDAVAVDISFILPDGTETEPADSSGVHVEIVLPDEQKLSGDEFSLLHVADSGDIEFVENAEVSGNGAEFDAESFSMYVLTSNVQVDVTNAFMANGQRGNNSEGNPFIIGIGETLELRYDSNDYNASYFTVRDNDYEGDVHRIVRDTQVGYDGNDGFDHNDKGYLSGRWIGSTEGTCRIVRVKDGQDVDTFYVKVVYKPAFIVKNSGDDARRRLLEDELGVTAISWDNWYYDLYAYVGETYTFSVNGYHYDYFSTSNNDEVLSMQEIYTEGNTNVAFTCEKEGTADVTINGKKVHFVVGNKVYMKLNDGRRLELHQALNELDKTKVNDPFVIYAVEGETITLSVDGYNSHLLGFKDWDSIGDEYDLSDYIHRGKPYYEDENTFVDFTCLKHGETTINVNGNEVKVIISHPLYVKESLTERDIDRINEWVSSQNFMDKRSGYVPNSPYSPWGACYPYQLYDGDTLTLRIPADDIEGAYLQVADASALTLETGSLYEDNNEINVSFLAHNTSDENIETKIELKDSLGNVIRTMYVGIPSKNDKILDHADIEIADGGIYTITKVTRNADGTIVKTITQYSAYVNEVNESILYQADGTSCDFYYEDINGMHLYDDVHGYLSSDYWKDPTITPGDSQYEYTSKYNLQTGTWSNKKYYADQVGYAVFNTDLILYPKKERSIVYDSGNEVISDTGDVDISGQPSKTVDGVKFTMNHQDVIDAFNKCPNHSGLDFTVMAYSALVEFELSKELTGGTVTADQFEFGIYDSNGELVSTAKNNSAGIVTFNNLHFEKSGTYNYTISEIVKTPESNILYDDSVINLSITVVEDINTHKLTAELNSDLTSFTFVNHRTYTLPSTGGGGVLPFIMTGSVIIIFSFAMIIVRKRKEDN